MTTTTPLPIRLAQTLGITTSLLLAGTALSTSITTVPRLLESPPSLLLQQWGHMYSIGKKTGPPVSLLASLSYFYLAYRAHTSPWLFSAAGAGRGVWAYVAAGVLGVGIVPYTFAVLMPTNKKLLGMVEVQEKVELSTRDLEVKEEGERSAHQLVDWWGVLNLGRGLLLVGSGVLGLWSSLD